MICNKCNDPTELNHSDDKPMVLCFFCKLAHDINRDLNKGETVDSKPKVC